MPVALRQLVRASHPVPTLVVTLAATLLCVSASGTAARTALLSAAVLTGQLSIGWSNDLIDADRDSRAGRSDKPAARGTLSRSLLLRATGLALAATVPLSLACGVPAGCALLVVVLMGWAYNLGLKSTPASFVPYAIAFGTLPHAAALAASGEAAPWWLAAPGALLGVAAHLLNCVDDLEDDAATGVRGFPHRLGERRSRGLAAASLGAAVLLLLVGAQASLPVAVPVALATAAAVVAVVTSPGRTAFRALLALVVLLLASAAVTAIAFRVMRP